MSGGRTSRVSPRWRSLRGRLRAGRPVLRRAGGAAVQLRREALSCPAPGDVSGDRRTSIEDLNLTATTYHAQIAGEIRLQIGNRRGSHRDRHGLQSRTKQVSNRVPTIPSPADGLETGEIGLTCPFARADAGRDNMRAATEGVEITRREEGSCRTVAPRQGRRRCRAGRQRPASSRLGMPTKPGGVYNATVRGIGEMAEEA